MLFHDMSDVYITTLKLSESVLNSGFGILRRGGMQHGYRYIPPTYPLLFLVFQCFIIGGEAGCCIGIVI